MRDVIYKSPSYILSLNFIIDQILRGPSPSSCESYLLSEGDQNGFLFYSTYDIFVSNTISGK